MTTAMIIHVFNAGDAINGELINPLLQPNLINYLPCSE